MSKVLLISENTNSEQEVKTLLEDFGLKCDVVQNAQEALDYLNNTSVDIALVDTDVKESNIVTKKIKTHNTEGYFQVILLVDKDTVNDEINDCIGFADGFVSKPINENILISTLNSHIKIKKTLDKYKEDNKELNKSLYQLDVLYNTSSKFAGTLDKQNLYDIMFEALEKTLGYNLASALMLNNNQKCEFFINALKKPTEEVINAIFQRLKNIDTKNTINICSDMKDVEFIEKIKPSYKNEFYDLKMLNYDRLSAPVKINDKFYGAIEIYRKEPFSKEDVTCFQSIVHQFALPLRSVISYSEIKNANAKLKKLESIKSEFVSIVSHELRTPLTPINNSLEIVLSEQAGKISDTAKNFINMAKRNVTRLSGIIEDLLDLSRMQTGKFDFKFKKTSILPSLELIEKTFESQAKNKSLNFSMNIEDNLPDIYADSHRVEQILSNLVTNAIKFTDEGGDISIKASLIQDKDIIRENLIKPIDMIEGNYIKIEVKDTGVGIDESDIPKIFDKFSQIENSLTRNAGGVGLGLTITKHFADSHLGLISVKSIQGEGSSFYIYIPAYDIKKKFYMDAKVDIKHSHSIGIIHITQNEASTITDSLKNKHLLKLTKNSKEANYIEDDKHHYLVTLDNLEASAFDFMTKSIEKELTGNLEWQKYGIVLKRAYCKNEEDVEISKEDIF